MTQGMGTGSFVSEENCKLRKDIPELFRPKDTQLPGMLLVTLILSAVTGAFAEWGFSC